MAVAFSPDGKYIVSGSLRYSIQKRETNSGLLLQTFLGHECGVTCISYSPDGKYIVSGSHDHTVRIWNSTSGENIHILRGHASSIFSVAYPPDGKHIVSSSAGYYGFVGRSGACDSSVRVWETNSGKPVDVLKTEFMFYFKYFKRYKCLLSFNSISKTSISTSILTRVWMEKWLAKSICI
jgi:WD40 repeat protein